MSNHETGTCPRVPSTAINTSGLNLANFEGMCLGPTLSDGSRCLVLISDTQAQSLVSEYLQVVTIK